MMGTTRIEWADYTWNPWRGCAMVSDGCANCYAEQWSKRNPKVLGEWGANAPRIVASADYWQQPLRWNAAAQKKGERRRVLCASMGDVFEDRADLDAPLARVLKTIQQTPNLDWLLLTKRPQLFVRRMAKVAAIQPQNAFEEEGAELARQWGGFGICLPNIWMGVSVEDDLRLSRIYDLNDIAAPIRFVSCEPLLRALDFSDGPLEPDESTMGDWSLLDFIDWVIVGGESGPNARPCRLAWIRDVVRQCKEASVPVFVKQLGTSPHGAAEDRPVMPLKMLNRKGCDMEEWPEDLRIREFPKLVVP